MRISGGGSNDVFIDEKSKLSIFNLINKGLPMESGILEAVYFSIASTKESLHSIIHSDSKNSSLVRFLNIQSMKQGSSTSKGVSNQVIIIQTQACTHCKIIIELKCHRVQP